MEDKVLKVFSNRETESELRTSLKPLAYKLCQNHADALDLIQQTYEKALINSDAFGGGSLKAWMCTIMKNHFIDLTRKKREDLMGDDLPEGSRNKSGKVGEKKDQKWRKKNDPK